MKSIRFILGLITLAALALTAADSGRAQSSRPELTEEFHQTYPLSATGRVSLSNINGSVRISAWDKNEVKVDAVKRAYTQERLREAEINVSASSGAIEIETEYPDYHWDSRDRQRHENPASVEYTLTVPRTARIEEVSLVNGGLDIDGVSGPVHASSVNGKVTARGLNGSVNLSVVNGRLEATLDSVGGSGSVNLSAVNGPLVATLPSDSNATVRADTVHGSISNDFNLPVRVGEYVGRELAGRLGQGGTRVSLNNVNGSIQIKRASDGKSPSAVTNLLSETRASEDLDDDNDDDNDVDEDMEDSAREAERDARDAQREIRDAQREIERETRKAQRDAAKISKEAAKAAKDVAKDVEKAVARGDFDRDFGDDARRITARESNSYQVSGSPRVRVETFDGAVTVHAWDKNEVTYTATKRAFDEKEMKGVTVQANGSGNEVTLRAQFDKSFAHSYHEHDGRVTSYSSNADVEFDVYVPRNAVVFVSSGDGRLRVEGINGELDLHTGDGTIDVTGSRGRLKAETGDGRIRVEDFDGDADARTGDGRIYLDGNFRSLSARTGDGTISLSMPEGSNATIETNAESVSNDGVAVAETPDTENRVRRWRIGGGGQTFTLRTGDGRIILRRR